AEKEEGNEEGDGERGEAGGGLFFLENIAVGCEQDEGGNGVGESGAFEGGRGGGGVVRRNELKAGDAGVGEGGLEFVDERRRIDEAAADGGIGAELIPDDPWAMRMVAMR